MLELHPHVLTVGLDHKLDMTGVPVMGSGDKGLKPSMSDAKLEERTVYRIDKDELAAGMGRVRDNLARLFYAGASGDEKRRRLIVDLEPPRFEPRSDDPSSTASADAEFSSLNNDQRIAVEKVLSAKDYALILGMPGTGKTTTIAEIVKAIARRGKSVLLTSYTHSAVDNILQKLEGAGLSTLRLGNVDKVSVFGCRRRSSHPLTSILCPCI